MRIAGHDKVDEIQEENDAVSLCSLYAGGETFGIDTNKIREVLGQRDLQRVPMSPLFIAGVVPYRGEVLTTVNLRALLGMELQLEKCCVLVMDDDEAAERFGLVVDAVGGVVTVSRTSPGSESVHVGGARQMAVRWSVQDGGRLDGAARPAEAVPVATVRDWIVQDN